MDALDPIDRRILELLLHDGRTPAAQIAEQIGLSRPAVAERIEKLERSGVICGTTVVLNPGSIGLDVTAFVFARHGRTMDPKKAKIFNRFLERDEILEAHSVAGDDCYLLKVRTTSIGALNALVTELGSAPLSLSTRTTIVLETFCEKVGGLLLPQESGDEA
jgi:Lrp/AsnC family leucine-responsive transcriptional regulator